MKNFHANVLAQFVHDLRFEDLPAPVVKKAKTSILDNLGLALGGSGSTAAGAVLAVARRLNGPREATAVRFGDRLSANLAALVNGTATHSNDWTDTILACVVHCGPVVVPAAVAMAEMAKLDGKALLALVVAGYEVAGRVGLAINSKPAMVHHRKGFHGTSTCGVFGAAAIAGKALGLGPDGIAHALGIAGSSSSGLIESFTGPVGADTSRSHPGKAAHDGILAALLSQHGLTGPHSIFEGRDGFLHAYSEADQFTPHLLVEALGTRFTIMDVAIKYHNGTHAIASSVDALQTIVAAHRVSADDVSEIRAFVPTMHAFIGGSDEAAMYAPPTYIKAQMSLPYTLAVALLDGELFLDQYSPARLTDERVRRVARLVKVTADPDMDRRQNAGQWPSRVEVVTRGGQRYESFFEYPKGSPQNPLTDAELQRKFTRLSEKVLDAKRIDAIIHAVDGLEQIDTAATLAGLLVA